MQALTSGLDRQRQHIREVLREKRQRRDESAYEAHAAAGMVLLAEQRLKARENQTKSNASKQKTLVRRIFLFELIKYFLLFIIHYAFYANCQLL